MNKYIFSTPYMCSGILVKASSLNEAKKRIRQYLCVKILPRNTQICEYTFDHDDKYFLKGN